MEQPAFEFPFELPPEAEQPAFELPFEIPAAVEQPALELPFEIPPAVNQPAFELPRDPKEEEYDAIIAAWYTLKRAALMATPSKHDRCCVWMVFVDPRDTTKAYALSYDPDHDPGNARPWGDVTPNPGTDKRYRKAKTAKLRCQKAAKREPINDSDDIEEGARKPRVQHPLVLFEEDEKAEGSEEEKKKSYALSGHSFMKLISDEIRMTKKATELQGDDLATGVFHRLSHVYAHALLGDDKLPKAKTDRVPWMEQDEPWKDRRAKKRSKTLTAEMERQFKAQAVRTKARSTAAKGLVESDTMKSARQKGIKLLNNTCTFAMAYSQYAECGAVLLSTPDDKRKASYLIEEFFCSNAPPPRQVSRQSHEPIAMSESLVWEMVCTNQYNNPELVRILKERKLARFRQQDKGTPDTQWASVFKTAVARNLEKQPKSQKKKSAKAEAVEELESVSDSDFEKKDDSAPESIKLSDKFKGMSDEDFSALVIEELLVRGGGTTAMTFEFSLQLSAIESDALKLILKYGYREGTKRKADEYYHITNMADSFMT